MIFKPGDRIIILTDPIKEMVGKLGAIDETESAPQGYPIRVVLDEEYDTGYSKFTKIRRFLPGEIALAQEAESLIDLYYNNR